MTTLPVLPTYMNHPLVTTEMVQAIAHDGMMTEFIGHTETQVREFIIGDKKAYPNEFFKRRQICRELWARIGVAISNEYSSQKAQIECDLHAAEEERLIFWNRFTFTPWGKRKMAAKMALCRLEWQQRKAQIAQLKLDTDQRIIRESAILLDILKSLPPPADDRLKAELDGWRSKAESEPRLRGLIPPAEGGSDPGILKALG